MVAETTPGADVQDEEVLDLDAGDATDETEGFVEDDATTEEGTDEDPLASLRARLDEIAEEIAPLKSLNPNQIGPALGRIGKLQSDFERLSKVNPLAEIDPRLDATESLNRAVAQALIANDLVDDTSKQSLRDALSSLDGAKSTREREQLKRELRDEIQGATSETEDAQADSWQSSAEAQAAQRALYRAATRAGIDPVSLPWADANRLGTLAEAEDLLYGALDKGSTDSTAADRVDSRRRAANGGSPARSGAANSVERDLERLSADGIPIEDEAARRRAAAALGVDL